MCGRGVVELYDDDDDDDGFVAAVRIYLLTNETG